MLLPVRSHWNSTLKRRKHEFLPLRTDLQQMLATAGIAMRGSDTGNTSSAPAPAAGHNPLANPALTNAFAMATLLGQHQQQLPQVQQQQGALAAALAAALLQQQQQQQQQQQKQQQQSPSVAAEAEKLNQLLGPLMAQMQAAGARGRVGHAVSHCLSGLLRCMMSDHHL
jgi:uncharacterized protein YfaS (alpha-2-macroglobulin family)